MSNAWNILIKTNEDLNNWIWVALAFYKFCIDSASFIFNNETWTWCILTIIENQ